MIVIMKNKETKKELHIDVSKISMIEVTESEVGIYLVEEVDSIIFDKKEYDNTDVLVKAFHSINFGVYRT